MAHGEVIRRLLLPTDQDAAEAVHPGMRALDDPATGSGAGVALGVALLAARPEMECETERQSELARLGVIIAFARQRCCGCSAVGTGRATAIASSVSRISL